MSNWEKLGELIKEIKLIEKEVLFWLNRVNSLEITIDLAREQGNTEQEEAHLNEYSEILARMMAENKRLEVFRKKYNKLAEKERVEIIL